MSTAGTTINVNKGTLSIEFDGEIVHFNIFYAMKYLEKSNSIFALNVITPLVLGVFEFDGKDELEIALTKHLELGATLNVELSDEP